ncbi:ubiquitin-related modifier 1 [Physcia stellaris]|nr:ubiquitin-related modifier 1 [Physcia stellaris]
MAEHEIPIVVDFFGGLESLFSNQKQLKLALPAKDEAGRPANMDFLIRQLHQKYLRGRKDFFIVDDAVRPGILVLINDADWELEGEGKYELQKDDNVLFVSTLHGG